MFWPKSGTPFKPGKVNFFKKGNKIYHCRIVLLFSLLNTLKSMQGITVFFFMNPAFYPLPTLVSQFSPRAHLTIDDQFNCGSAKGLGWKVTAVNIASTRHSATS